MSTVFFTADLHFGHTKVAGLRGHSGFVGNDWEIIQAWEKQVRPRDRVYVLGDISGGRKEEEEYALQLLKTLPGEKHLIAGNHDSVASIHRNGYKHLPRYLEVFESVRDFARIRIQKTDILLSHYPYIYEGDGKEREGSRYTQYRLPFLGAPLVHGHTHSTKFATDEYQFCVSWDAHRSLVPLSQVENYFFPREEISNETSN